MGNLQVRFLEGWAPAMAPGYSTVCLRVKDYCSSSLDATMPGSDFHKVGFFRRCATVFKISRESSLFDTARAMLMAPTSAQ